MLRDIQGEIVPARYYFPDIKLVNSVKSYRKCPLEREVNTTGAVRGSLPFSLSRGKGGG